MNKNKYMQLTERLSQMVDACGKSITTHTLTHKVSVFYAWYKHHDS